MNFKKYGRKQDAVTIETFRLDMFKELDVEETSEMREMFQRAWRYGHSFGYDEVFEHFKGLLDIYLESEADF
jgi:hypothetical protein